MTREEAFERNNCGDDEIVNIIYDDLESRICENCKHFQGEHKNSLSCYELGIWQTKDFGCNKFEKKGD